jgi:hypothetical protein
MDQYSRFRNETWNIETPEDAEIVAVLLYFNYNWDTSFFPNGWTLEFNDVEITSDNITHERDRGNLGGWFCRRTNVLRQQRRCLAWS